MYCCFQEELHRSFTEASQKLHRSFTETSVKLLWSSSRKPQYIKPCFYANLNNLSERLCRDDFAGPVRFAVGLIWRISVHIFYKFTAYNPRRENLILSKPRCRHGSPTSTNLRTWTLKSSGEKSVWARALIYRAAQRQWFRWSTCDAGPGKQFPALHGQQ
jgi:hypothetical protein